METTLTMAGLLADAGAARLRGASPVSCAPAASAASAPSYGVRAHQAAGYHQLATWTKGAIAEPTTVFMVLDRKNRPTRPLLELSP